MNGLEIIMFIVVGIVLSIYGAFIIHSFRNLNNNELETREWTFIEREDKEKK
jgi:hypothetical protein